MLLLGAERIGNVLLAQMGPASISAAACSKVTPPSPVSPEWPNLGMMGPGPPQFRDGR